MKIVFCIFVFFISGCALKNYLEPIELDQSQIKNIVVNDMWDNRVPLEAGKILDCNRFKKYTSNCAIIHCKNAPQEETKFKCLYYIPKTGDSVLDNKLVSSLKNYETKELFLKRQQSFLSSERKINIEKEIEKIKKDLIKNKFEKLDQLCRSENIICYLNKKYYPDGHINEIPSEKGRIYSYLLKFKSNKTEIEQKVEIHVF